MPPLIACSPARTPMRRVSARRQTGLTLVELLVAMVIMGFVLTLVSQAVFQVSLVTRSAQNATAELTGRWASGWTVSPVFANLVSPAEAPVGKSFEGTPDRLAGYSTLPVDGSQAGLKPFNLRLSPDRDGATGTAMLASSPAADGSTPTEAQVAGFPGRVEFAYMDAGGELHAQWPPLSVSATRAPEELPSAVAVRRPLGGELVMWYPFQGDTRRPPRASTPFGGLGP